MRKKLQEIDGEFSQPNYCGVIFLSWGILIGII
jgi:hypothetical protein